MVAFRFAIISVLLLLVVASAAACSIAYPVYKVQSSFWVKIYHEGKSIPGIEIRLSRYQDTNRLESSPFLTRISDKDGIIRIENLPVGKYFVSVISPGGGDGADLIVEKQETWEARNEVGLGWPFLNKVIKTRRVAGMLVNGNEIVNFQETALKNVPLSLLKLGSHSPTEITTTDSSGKFDFKQSELGFYVVRVGNDQNYPRVDILVEILPPQSKGLDYMALHLQMTSCGWTYKLESDAS